MSKWKRVKLSDVCLITMGQSPDSKSYNLDGDGLPFYQGNADFGEIHPTVKYFCNKPTKIAEKDDILISVRAPIGAVNIATEKCCIGRGLAALRTQKSILDTKYLFYVLKRKSNELNLKGTGSTFKAINKQVLSNLMIPVPSLEIQKQIANTLDSVAELLALQKQQLHELDNLIKSIFYDMFGNPFVNNRHWDNNTLASYCYVNPKKTEVNLSEDALVSFVPMQNVSESGEINTSETRKYKDVKTGYTYFRENDVLFAKITPCMENGKGAIARNLINGIGFGSTEFHILRPIEGISTSEWLYHLTSLPTFRRTAEKLMTGSAGQKRVPASFFEKLSVPLPPYNLQLKFADIVTKIEEQKSQVRKAIEETQTLFDSLMSQYFDE